MSNWVFLNPYNKVEFSMSVSLIEEPLNQYGSPLQSSFPLALGRFLAIWGGYHHPPKRNRKKSINKDDNIHK